jgi:protein arginine kinase activator
MQCDRCSKPATVHLTEIVDGEKIEKHLCEDCASSEGITIKASLPLSQLLEDFVVSAQSGPPSEEPEPQCDVCGLSFSEFRKGRLLGCPNDYEAFSEALDPLLQRAHEGATQHVGKAPHSAGSAQQRHNAVLRLRGQLKSAVTAEDYERAAALRDQIKELEER